MSGTSASLNRKPLTLALPVPHIGLVAPRTAFNTPMNPASREFTFAANGDKIFMRRMPLFSAVDLPEDLFKADLRLELLWYRRVARRAGSVENIGSAYHHPAHFLVGDPDYDSPTNGSPYAPVLPPSRFRGGKRANPGLTAGLRSEWTVKGNGQRFFIDTLGDFLQPGVVGYMDATGNGQSIQTYVTTNRSGSGGGSVGGGYFGYGRQLRPNYFAFRFSIQDPKDSRARITGPISRVIKMAHAVHPFYPDDTATQAQSRTVNAIHPKYQPDVFNTWFETRLPSNN